MFAQCFVRHWWRHVNFVRQSEKPFFEQDLLRIGFNAISISYKIVGKVWDEKIMFKNYLSALMRVEHCLVLELISPKVL